ncbi:hypothetical protein FB45DRAFT_147577 [Roridomyces roridus]|uniref:Uncharacterized protein n=1 Tax=Roridomyces roridus TaxID=1738132 RepID=A0AAD7FHC7_9AGAR|nr:hypothetical protein FB45DRAFT_147577 [Roridomyces roridus]
MAADEAEKTVYVKTRANTSQLAQEKDRITAERERQLEAERCAEERRAEAEAAKEKTRGTTEVGTASMPNSLLSTPKAFVAKSLIDQCLLALGDLTQSLSILRSKWEFLQGQDTEEAHSMLPLLDRVGRSVSSIGSPLQTLSVPVLEPPAQAPNSTPPAPPGLSDTPPSSFTKLCVEAGKSILLGLRGATGMPHAAMSYSSYERLVEALYGYRLVGWPDGIPMQSPADMKVGGAFVVRDLWSRLRSGICRWVKIPQEERNALAVKYKDHSRPSATSAAAADSSRGKSKKRRCPDSQVETPSSKRAKSVISPPVAVITGGSQRRKRPNSKMEVSPAKRRESETRSPLRLGAIAEESSGDETNDES